jgi:TolB-like protein/DNA-binding winged helix-turn-helix (wHTH) protein/Tfp pilus assembly protein PilF
MAEGSTTFGSFVLDRGREKLLRNGDVVPIGHRGFVLLSSLLEAAGEPVSKAALMDAAWPGTIVEEANLTVQIAALRKALGDNGETLIVTVPRVGYRLLLPAAREDHSGGRPLLAVLPFANLSSDPEQDFFADGIAEDLITALSRFRAFSVVARGSSFALRGQSLDAREVGRRLGSRYLLEGSVRRSGDVLRVSAKLADATTGGQLWAERFDGGREDIFSMQDRITEAVVGFIQPQLERAEVIRARQKRPDNLDAYDLYLRALPLVQGPDPAGYQPAIELLRRAIALDPGYGIAAAMLGWAYEKRLTLNMPSLTDDDAAEVARLAHTALRLDPNDPRVLVICGWLLIAVVNDFDTGLAAAQRAYAANPNDLLVINLAATANLIVGDLLEARAAYHRALALGANAPETYLNLAGVAHSHLHAGEYEAALEWGRRSLETFNDWPVNYWTLAAAAAHLGRLEEARAYLRRLRELVPNFSMSHAANLPMPDPVRWAHLVDGLRKAGLSDT